MLQKACQAWYVELSDKGVKKIHINDINKALSYNINDSSTLGYGVDNADPVHHDVNEDKDRNSVNGSKSSSGQVAFFPVGTKSRR